jgi:hypothetical protein
LFLLTIENGIATGSLVTLWPAMKIIFSANSSIPFKLNSSDNTLKKCGVKKFSNAKKKENKQCISKLSHHKLILLPADLLQSDGSTESQYFRHFSRSFVSSSSFPSLPISNRQILSMV